MKLLTFLARRFVAGENVDQVLSAVAALNKMGILATIDYLGENVNSREEALTAADEYIRLLDAIEKSGVKSNVSIKLTMMGLDIDDEFCCGNVERIVKHAAPYGNFVRIDMEGTPVTQRTLDIFYRLREKYDNVGIVIQAYLFRSESDIENLNRQKSNVRLCKGAYKEPPTLAFPSKEQVNENYLKLAKFMLTHNDYAALATHDRRMILPLRQFIAQHEIPKSRYEWQMLYGIERNLQKALAQEGETVRVYVPYGTDWLGYYKRRMMERRENFFFALKHFLQG